jgi:hypothetical protein
MLKGSSSSLESEFKRLADSQSSNLGKIYESLLKVVLAKRPEKKKGLKVEKKPQSKELGVKAERKSPKDLGLRVENKAKSKIIERGANEVGVLPEVAPTASAKESLLPKLLYEYSKDTGKSRVMLSPEESKAVLDLTDKSTKVGDIIENGADLKISDSKDRVLFETDSKGVVIYSQNQRNPSVLKENGLGTAMDSLRSDLSNVISRAEARKPLSKGVEELNQDAMSFDKEVISKAEPLAVPVKMDLDIPIARTEAERTDAPAPPVPKSTVTPPVATKAPVSSPKSLSDQEKVSLLNEIGLKPGSSIDMKGGGNLSVARFPSGSLSVMLSDEKGVNTVIASSFMSGEITASPQFSDQVASALQDYVSERGVEKAVPSVEAPAPAAEKSMVPPPTVSKAVVVPPKELGDQEKIRLLNNPGLNLQPGSSVQMKGGSLSVEQNEGTLVVFFSDGERAGEQIASVENGMTKISPQFSGQVASMMEEHISELPHEVERASAEEQAPEIDGLDLEEDYELGD